MDPILSLASLENIRLEQMYLGHERTSLLYSIMPM